MPEQLPWDRYFDLLKIPKNGPQETDSMGFGKIRGEWVQEEITSDIYTDIHSDTVHRLIQKIPDIDPMDIARHVSEPIIDALFASHTTYNEQSRSTDQNLSQLEKKRICQTILDNINEGYYETNLIGDFTFVNKSMCKILNLSQKEVLNSNVRQFLDKDLIKGIDEVLKNAPLNGITLKDWEIKGPHIKNRHLDTRISMIRDVKGDGVGYRSLAREMGEGVFPQDRLKEALVINHQIISAISSFLIVIKGDNTVIFWNAISEKIFGIASGATIDKPLSDLRIQLDWQKFMKSVLKCRTSKKTIRLDDLTFTRPDGRNGILGVTISPAYITKNEKLGVLIMGTEITDRKLLERQLVQAQKLESIGQLAAGIAHEINTPTQYISDNTRFLQDSFSSLSKIIKMYGLLFKAIKVGSVSDTQIKDLEDAIEEEDLEYLEGEIPVAINQCLEGLDRVTNIVRSMKEFSHPGSEEMTAADINKAIENIVTVARNEWKYVAEMSLDLDPSLPPVSCVQGKINQVFLNILINAAQAISEIVGKDSEDKGKIKISTHVEEDSVEIRISDTGNGIPEEIRHKIFDPFFTTKEVGAGTGQGLHICHSVIVEKHGGSIRFDTEKGKGTTFIIRLPIGKGC